MEVAMNNEERRETLSLQHRQIRATIKVVRHAAVDLADGSTTAFQLREQVAALRLTMELHLATEELLLTPVLEHIDAWGPERLALLHVDHAHQRLVLAELSSERVCALPAELYARRTLRMLEEILTDLDSEDRDLLDVRVLRDDLIQLDASDC
jgi:hypothetical protein